MKAPATPPSWRDVLTPGLLGVTVVDDEYRHWESIRYRDPPNGLTAEQHWAVLKLRRFSAAVTLPILAKSGRPMQLSLTPKIHATLRRIERLAAGKIVLSNRRLPDGSGERFIARSLMEEAIESSLLEGAVSTRQDAETLIRSGATPSSKSEWMIYNNHQAMQDIRRSLDEPLTMPWLLDLHATLTRETLERSVQGRVQGVGEKRVAIVESLS